MNRLKKSLSLILVGAMTFSLGLTGCNSKAKPADSAATTAPSAKAGDANADTSKPVDLVWYYIGPAAQADVGLVEAEANKYLKDKINATIKLNCLDFGSYDTKMPTKIASGENFDILFTANWAVNYPLNAARGAFVDLTPMMDKYAPKTKQLLGDTVIKGASINGKLYAIPANKEMAHNWVVCLNEDIVKELNFDTSKIKKFEDLEPMLKEVKEKKPGVYPLEAVVGESPYRLLDFEKISDDNVPGAIYFDFRDTKVVNDFETPEAKAFYNTMHKWYEAGYIRKDADTVTDYNADEKAGKIFSHIKSGKPGKAAELSLAQGVKWIQLDLTKPVATTREMNGSMQAVSKTSKNPERALMFLELFNNDKQLNNLINFGVENKHYVKKSDNIIDFAPATEGGKKSGYNPQTGWVFGNQFINYLFPTEDPQKWDKFKQFNASAKVSPLMGFNFDAEPVKTELAAIVNIKKQYFPLLETGKGNPDEVLPQMTSKMKAAGLDKVLAEMQKQVDEFNKTNKK